MKCCVVSLHGGLVLIGELTCDSYFTASELTNRLFPFVNNGSFIAAAADRRLVLSLRPHSEVHFFH